MNKKLKILFFCMIVVDGVVHSQKTDTAKRNFLPIVQMTLHKAQSFNFRRLPVSGVSPVPFLAADFYSKQLGFFCRQEIKIDKAIKVPIRFRLGSVEQCNWLEGKRR